MEFKEKRTGSQTCGQPSKAYLIFHSFSIVRLSATCYVLMYHLSAYWSDAAIALHNRLGIHSKSSACLRFIRQIPTAVSFAMGHLFSQSSDPVAEFESLAAEDQQVLLPAIGRRAVGFLFSLSICAYFHSRSKFNPTVVCLLCAAVFVGLANYLFRWRRIQLLCSLTVDQQINTFTTQPRNQ
jgi:hypothetical protein